MSSMPRRAPTALAIALGFALSGCATFGFGPAHAKAAPKTYHDRAEAAYHRAKDTLDAHDYETAVERLQKVKDRYPYSRFAALAELRIADALFEQDKFIESADAYGRFAKLRPGHPDAPYALYRQGLSLMRQAPGDFFILPPSYEKDLTDVRQCIQVLDGFKSAYPKSKYMKKVDDLLTKARDRIVHHELYVADFYKRRHKWRGVAGRYQDILQTYPGLGFDAQAKVGLAEAYLRMDHPRAADAKKLLGEVMHSKKASSEWRSRAEDLAKEIPAAAPKAGHAASAPKAAPAAKGAQAAANQGAGGS